MRYMIYLIVGWLLLLAGCKSDRKEALLPGLIRAEAIVWDEPEEALTLLDTMQVPVRDEYQYATWCLLYTQAQNRNNITYTSDSLIQVALHYFEPRDDIHRKALTWFYTARVYADLRQTVEASDFYLKAREAALQTSDHRLQYLVCLNYGWLCLNQMALNDAKGLLNEAYIHAQESGTGKWRVFALDYIGRYYAFNQQMDSATFFLEQSVDLARQVNDTTSLITALNDAAIVLSRTDEYDRAISYLHESIDIRRLINKNDFYPSYHNLGETYRNLGIADSAVYYLNKALETKDISLLRSCYFSLAEVNNEIGQWQNAVYYVGLFWQYTDSIAQSTHHKDITEMLARSEYQRLENINSQLKVEKSNLLRAGLLFFVCLLGIIIMLIYIFQRKFLRVEHSRLSTQNQLQEQIRIYQANEQEINKNNEIIRSITEQLARRPALEEQQDFQENRLLSTRNHSELLQQQNQQLEQKISAYLRTLREKETKQSVCDKIARQNRLLQSNALLFEKGLLKRMKLTGQLKLQPQYLTDEMQRIIYEEVDIIYPGFTTRLSSQYTRLSRFEIFTCCLIKLRFTSSQIATMTGVDAKSVTKRKSRIKENILTNQPDIWKKYSSLDTYLQQY